MTNSVLLQGGLREGQADHGLAVVEHRLRMPDTGFISVEEAVERYGNGEIVAAIDDPDRENEGDFLVAAEKITPEKIAFMRKFGGGLICMPCASELLDPLAINLMVPKEEATGDTNFTVTFSISSSEKKPTSRFSASRRAETIRRVALGDVEPEELEFPGGVLGLRAEDGGVLQRRGHTETAVDLARLAGLRPAGAIVEVLKDGEPARGEMLTQIAAEHNIALFTVSSLVEYLNDAA